jgi:hypothetical protein
VSGVTEDLHSPTTAGPVPEPEPEPAPAYAPAPSSSPSAAGRPEVLAGAAFAGGLLAALILRRLGR